MCFAARADFVLSEKLLEKQDNPEEKAYYSGLVAVTRAVCYSYVCAADVTLAVLIII